jgi:hypothetical protein
VKKEASAGVGVKAPKSRSAEESQGAHRRMKSFLGFENREAMALFAPFVS